MGNTPYSNQFKATKHRDYAFLKLVLAWVVAILVALGLQAFVFQSYQVYGHSMEPTLQDKDYLIISKVGPTLSNFQEEEYVPERGDIVVLEPNTGPRLIKRIIGLPQERVVVRNDNITIFNDEHPKGFDPYEKIGLDHVVDVSGNKTVDIPKDQLFVVGDNRNGSGSSDSRNQLGTVSTDDVIGSLVLRLWPIDGFETF